MAGTKYWDARYMARTRALRAKRLPCWICGQPIDYAAHWKDGRSFTADHVQPMARGGKLYGELRPAHRACNSSRGAGRAVAAPAAHAVPVSPPQRNSIRW